MSNLKSNPRGPPLTPKQSSAVIRTCTKLILWDEKEKEQEAANLLTAPRLEVFLKFVL